jgi:hypothetical protein
MKHFMNTRISLAVLAWWLSASAASSAQPEKLVLFDFEEAADLKAWASLRLPDANLKKPPARIERSTDKASSGKHSLKITFGGGSWPTLTTTRVPADWSAWHTLKADVTVNRPCVVGFTVCKSAASAAKAMRKR